MGLVAVALGGCTSNAIPGLNTPSLALITPAPLPPPPMVITPVGTSGATIPGVPVVTYPQYLLEAATRSGSSYSGRHNLSRVYSFDRSKSDG